MLPNPLFQFSIGENINIKVHMYGVMIAVGILAAFVVLYMYGKKLGLATSFVDFIYYNAILSIAIGFVAAAAFQGLYNFIEDPSRGFSMDGGITFIGGLIGGATFFLLVYFILRKKLKGKLFDALSLIPCCILIGHAFGRVGCFFAGCCYGKATGSFLGVKFPELMVKVHPTMLYEAAFLFIMFGICSYLLLKKNFKHNMSLYLISYGVFRFLIEFVRDDHRGKLLGFITPSQFWAILMVLLSVGVFFIVRYLDKKNTAAETAEEKAVEEITESKNTSEEMTEVNE